MYDRQNNVSDLVDVATGGAAANASSSWPSISDDGRYVAFQSGATNLAGTDLDVYRDVFVRDRQLGVTTRLSNRNFESEMPAISGDGQRVVFHTRANNILASDTNGLQDVVLWHMSSGVYQLVSHNSAGGVSNGISWISTSSSRCSTTSCAGWPAG